MNCIKSYTLTEEQKKASKELVDEIRNKHSIYESIFCETSFDAGVYFEPTEEELSKLDDTEQE